MNIAILFDGASAYATEPDMLILGTVEAIEAALVDEGNKVTYIPIHMDGKWIGKLQRGKFDLAFNMCEGIDGVATLEPAVIGVLELFGIPFTGASSYTTNVCLRKHVVNTLLDKAGLPVPRFGALRRAREWQGSRRPAPGRDQLCVVARQGDPDLRVRGEVDLGSPGESARNF